VIRTFVAALLVSAGLAQSSGGGPTQQPSTNQTSVNQSAAQPQDPAAVTFATETGMVLHAVKPANAADYELAIIALREGLLNGANTETKTLAAAWRVYKATEPDAKSSVIYVHFIDPVVPGVDYRPSLWLDKVLSGAPAEMLLKYRDAFAMPPTKLSLTLLKKEP
jgi:hypothetical protein